MASAHAGRLRCLRERETRDGERWCGDRCIIDRPATQMEPPGKAPSDGAQPKCDGAQPKHQLPHGRVFMHTLGGRRVQMKRSTRTRNDWKLSNADCVRSGATSVSRRAEWETRAVALQRQGAHHAVRMAATTPFFFIFQYIKIAIRFLQGLHTTGPNSDLALVTQGRRRGDGQSHFRGPSERARESSVSRRLLVAHLPLASALLSLLSTSP